MAYKQIEYETNGRIAIVRTNRPKYRNAQSRLLIEEMDDAFIKAERDQRSETERGGQQETRWIGCSP